METKHRRIKSPADRFNELLKERDELKALNAELLEALKAYNEWHRRLIELKLISRSIGAPIRIKAHQLIAKAEGKL